jgi:hypothetical protein
MGNNPPFLILTDGESNRILVNVWDISSVHPYSAYDRNKSVIYMKNPPTKIYTTSTVNEIQELISDEYRAGSHAEQIARD